MSSEGIENPCTHPMHSGAALQRDSWLCTTISYLGKRETRKNQSKYMKASYTYVFGNRGLQTKDPWAGYNQTCDNSNTFVDLFNLYNHYQWKEVSQPRQVALKSQTTALQLVFENVCHGILGRRGNRVHHGWRTILGLQLMWCTQTATISYCDSLTMQWLLIRNESWQLLMRQWCGPCHVSSFVWIPSVT